MTSELIRSRPGGFDIRPAEATAATPVADEVFLSPGLSNSYLVRTPEGRVVINTGMGFEAPVHKACFDAVDPGPVRYVLLTQGHVDHVGGVDLFREPGTLVVAQAANAACQADDERIHRFRVRRSMVYWATAVQQADRFVRRQPTGVPAQSKPVPDVTFSDRFDFELGGTRFECISTPGGETVDSMVVWMPERRIAFVGNVFGALFGHIPNLVTLRADRLRFALPFVEAVETVLALEPELLCTGHFEPIAGRAVIRAELERLRDAVRHVHDATVEGMNAGKDVHTLMREIELPEHLRVGEGYGKVSWDVRAIWEGYAGWFHARSTTELYPVPASSVAGDLVHLAGGVGSVVGAARARLEAGEPVEALHLLDVAQAAAPGDREVLEASIAAHEALLERVGGENFWETGWLRAQVAAARRALEDAG